MLLSLWPVLDDVVRFIGQKVAAVVADSEAIAEEACRRIEVLYDLLPAVFAPADAIAPGAPVLHPDKTPEHRVSNAPRNIIASVVRMFRWSSTTSILGMDLTISTDLSNAPDFAFTTEGERPSKRTGEMV